MADETIRLVAKTVLQRAEDYKDSVEVVIKNYSEKLHQTDQELQEILEQLDRQQYLNKEAVCMIAKINDEIKLLEIENAQMDEAITSLKSDLWLSRGQIDEIEHCRNKLQQELEEERKSNLVLEENLRGAVEKMAQIEKLTRKVNVLEGENECHSKECEMYKEKLSEYEKEIQELTAINESFSERCKKYEMLFTKRTLENQNTELEALQSEDFAKVIKPKLEVITEQIIDEDITDSEMELIKEIAKDNEDFKEIIDEDQIEDMIKLKETEEKENLEVLKYQLDVNISQTTSEDTCDEDLVVL